MSKSCPLCKQAKEITYIVCALGGSYSIFHRLGNQGDLRFSCVERAVLKYFTYAMPKFFGAALRTLGNAQRTKRERNYIIHSYFLQFLCSAAERHMPSAFVKWLRSQQIEIQNASLWQDKYFVALVVKNQLRHFWRKGQFTKIFESFTTCQADGKIIVRGKYGAYFEGHGSSMRIIFEETPNRASFSLTITSR